MICIDENGKKQEVRFRRSLTGLKFNKLIIDPDEIKTLNDVCHFIDNVVPSLWPDTKIILMKGKDIEKTA